MSLDTYLYAFKQRNYKAILGLLLTEKRLTRPFLAATRNLGLLVVAFGISLIVLTTVALARDAIPVVAAPGTLHYAFLKFLVVFISFQILFNYIAACSFSLRLGRCPASAAVPQNIAQLDSSQSSDDESDTTAEQQTVVAVVMPSESQAGEPRSRGGISAQSTTSSDSHRHPSSSKPPRGSALLCGALGGHTIISTEALVAIESLAAEADALSGAERRHQVLENAYRYCKTCRRLKAPREHHCSICNACVPKMDHHCPFINNCVDAENQRYFVLFLAWLTLGTLLATVFVGFGWLQQTMYETQLGRLQVKALNSPKAAERLARLRAPFGAQGYKLTSFVVTLAVVLVAALTLCLVPFLIHNILMALRNGTPIEDMLVNDKQTLFLSTTFSFRSPYNVGRWRNALEVFRTPNDPIVRSFVRRMYRVSEQTGQVCVVLPPPPRTALGRLRASLAGALLWVWLTVPPTLRPSTADGIHYTTYSREVKDANGHLLPPSGDLMHCV